jgi:hypothetical protein
MLAPDIGDVNDWKCFGRTAVCLVIPAERSVE